MEMSSTYLDLQNLCLSTRPHTRMNERINFAVALREEIVRVIPSPRSLPVIVAEETHSDSVKILCRLNLKTEPSKGFRGNSKNVLTPADRGNCTVVFFNSKDCNPKIYYLTDSSYISVEILLQTPQEKTYPNQLKCGDLMHVPR